MTAAINYIKFLLSRPCRRYGIFVLCWVFIWMVFWIHMGSNSVLNSAANTIESRELLASNLRQAQTVTQSSSSPRVAAQLPFIAVDGSKQSSERELVSELERKLPNLPLLYLYDQNRHVNKNKTCGRLPALYDIHFNNIYWQETSTTNGTFYLYGAYLDVRKNNRLGPTVRILGMIDRLEPKVKTYCLLWFEDAKEPVVSKVVEYKYIWYKKWGNYKPGIFQPYLLACQLPKSHWKKAPISVSVVERVCDTATNNLRVIYNPPKSGVKKDFAVCVKGLDFPNQDLSVRLIEWIELLSILGADKVFFYQLEIHPNVSKVIEHYVKKDMVDITPISLPGHQPNIQLLQHLYLKSKVNNKRQNELIPYNDCLYRNIYRYKYIALLDIDEVIMPLGDSNNWSDLMKKVEQVSLKVKNESRASYNFRNIYFMDEFLTEHLKQKSEDGSDLELDDIPEHMHMLRHIYRSANYTKPGQYVKCFHNPEKALILHNHFPLGCLGGTCTSFSVNVSMAHLQHYRGDCVKALKKACDRDFKSYSVLDTTIWKFKERLIERVSNTLFNLGFLKPDDGSIGVK